MKQQCTKCKRILNLTDFCVNNKRPSGRHFWCRQCANPKDQCACRELKTVGSSTCVKCKSAKNSINGDGTRKCRKCNLVLPIAAFHRSTARSDGLQMWCSQCQLKAKRDSHRTNPEKVHRQVKRWREKNPEAALRVATLYLRKYGLTLTEYNQLLEQQNGVCANLGCGNRPKEKISATLGVTNERFHVDHDHSCCPGNWSCGDCIRGLLCPNCNRALGFLNDDPSRITGLVKYIETATDKRSSSDQQRHRMVRGDG